MKLVKTSCESAILVVTNSSMMLFAIFSPDLTASYLLLCRSVWHYVRNSLSGCLTNWFFSSLVKTLPAEAPVDMAGAVTEPARGGNRLRYHKNLVGRSLSAVPDELEPNARGAQDTWHT